jgi:hypothetical protein
MTLTDLAKQLNLTIPHGTDFINGSYFYNAFLGNDIKPLWNGTSNDSYVIGLIVNGKELKYPIDLEDFKSEIEELKDANTI